MSFVSKNELDKFIYEDCQITNIEYKGEDLYITLEALIVDARNSQNTNYTESYADETIMVLYSAKIEEFLEEGYKLYDADDNLVEDNPDTIIEKVDYEKMLKQLKEGYMFSADCKAKSEEKNTYVFEIDMGAINEDGLTDPYATTYQITISFSESRVSWERYLNRVQK